MWNTKSILKSKVFRLIAGLAGIALIAFADHELNNAIPLALLYLVPVVAMSTVLRRWQIVLLGLLCMFVAEYSDAFLWTVTEGIPRDATYFLVYSAGGLYVSELLSRRRAEQTHVSQLEAEIEARRGIEEQLRLVVANSSIAIISADEDGMILQANEAAEQQYRSGSIGLGSLLAGTYLKEFMPSLARVQIRKQGWEKLRTMMQCQGLRATQEPFLADVWFSTYMTSSGGRLTAMIVDSSGETRDREEANLEQVLVGSRLAMGALLHEVRNICAAISVVQQNLLAAHGASGQQEDFDALRQLVTALERMASAEVAMVKRETTRVRLETFLRELYIIVSPSLRENEITAEWIVDTELPEVFADPQSLLQVFLNLVRNAEKALTPVKDAQIRVCARRQGGYVEITFADNGPGIKNEDELFRPFGKRKGATGLGLYLSRAMMLSFGGDLRYQPGTGGATFVVEMMVAEVSA
jgi:two-component system sensor kinase FixL